MGDTQSSPNDGYDGTETGSIVLSYKNSLLYQADLSLLKPGGWVNDTIVGFIFEYYANEQFKDISKDICFIAPAVSQFLKLCQGRTKEDISECLNDLNLGDKKYIIVAVNDSASCNSIGGSHWSTMVYSKSDGKIFYFDSYGNYNLIHAKCIQNRIGLHLPAFADAEFYPVDCPQQWNIVDCGLYAICFAEEVCKGLLQKRKDFYNVTFTADHAFQTRGRIKQIILRLAKDSAE